MDGLMLMSQESGVLRMARMPSQAILCNGRTAIRMVMEIITTGRANQMRE